MEEQSNPTGRMPLADIKPKMEFTGKVTRIELSGAVVDVNAEREGLLHISAMGKRKVNRVEDVLQIGQEIKVWARKINLQKGELQLTMIPPRMYEWGDLKSGMTVHGTVRRIEKFGVFVDFGSERPGLIHISELAHEYIKDAASIVSVGEEIDAQILDVNRTKRQVHLSRKALVPKETEMPEPEAEEEEEEIKTITAMEAAFLKAQSSAPVPPADKPIKNQATGGKKRRQQDELLERTLQTAPKK